MMAVADPLVMPLAREMLDCLIQEIAKVASPPKYVGLRPGSVVDFLLSTNGQDECCEGLAWVRPDLTYPSSGLPEPFPAQDEVPPRQGVSGWAITLELGAVRGPCGMVTDAGTIPSQEVWDEATQAVMDDFAAIRRAVCCFIDAKQGRKGSVLPGVWQPLPISGGCVGGFMQVVIRGPACDCQDAGPESS
jgi:hypothetical protein